jgi:hypothetical protein
MKPQAAVLPLAAVLALAPAPVHAGPEKPAKPVKLEDMAAGVKRITLTEKAVQRLGIETGRISEERIVRTQMVGGLVVAPSQIRRPAPLAAPGSFTSLASAGSTIQPVASAATAELQRGTRPDPRLGARPDTLPAGAAWIVLSLSRGEWERLAKDRPARLLPLATRDSPRKDLAAQPSGLPPVEDTKRSMLGVYYVVPGTQHGLEPNRRMRVELELAGGAETRKAVPYSAVYYDAKGNPWLYVNPAPLVFHRAPVVVERIAGAFAVLKEGPPLGTAVVTVGAPLLYGAEIFKK